MENTKTKYFQNCLGVFQGGGCKGSAYVGAYEEAFRRGVGFSELVGSSAGSITAVLIGAGATPEQLKEIIGRLNFKEFLKPAIKPTEVGSSKFIQLATSKWVKWVITNRFVRENLIVLSHLGKYNSSYIRDWIEIELRKLLGKDYGPVKFRDLRIPSTVIVTDLRRRGVRIYGTNYTPEEDVSFAVQASCNIPIFFQPVNMRYVDGGLLSNLPTFIFKDDKEKLYNKILAFSLESEEVNMDFRDFIDFGKAIISTTLDGNLDIQLGMQNDIHIIKIPTGSIQATDFDKINEENISFLINQGKKSTKSFFDNEVSNVNNSIIRNDISRNTFSTYNFIVQASNHYHKDIVIVDYNTNWVYDLFPTLLNWKENESKISVILKKNTDNEEHGSFRKRFLEHSGVNIIEVDEIPFRGLIFDGNNKDSCSAIILNKNYKEGSEYHSKMYFGNEDFDAINIMHEKINEFLPLNKILKEIISIEEIVEKLVIEKLKDVKQYSSSKIRMYIKEINISEVILITKYVRGYKYRQISILFELFEKYNIGYFKPARLNLANGKSTIITPPIIEKIGDKYYVIEGNTRFLHAFRNGIQNLFCVVVEGVTDPLPSTTRCGIKDLLLTDKPKIGQERYDGFSYENFRKIEKAVRDPKQCLL
jgi:predicted acylesterase/phospholipase RssA